MNRPSIVSTSQVRPQSVDVYTSPADAQPLAPAALATARVQSLAAQAKATYGRLVPPGLRSDQVLPLSSETSTLPAVLPLAAKVLTAIAPLVELIAHRRYISPLAFPAEISSGPGFCSAFKTAELLSWQFWHTTILFMVT